MTRRNTITVHLGEQGYLATFAGPHAQEIAELFDTCTLPLPWGASASHAVVLADVKARNPNCIVIDWNER